MWFDFIQNIFGIFRLVVVYILGIEMGEIRGCNKILLYLIQRNLVEMSILNKILKRRFIKEKILIGQIE